MKKDILVEPLYKERSYVKSLSVGMRLPLRHPIGFLRHLWPMMLLCVLTWAFLAKVVSPDVWALRELAFADGSTPSMLVGMPLCKVLMWGFVAILFLGVQVGQIGFLMQRYGELTYLPAVQPWRVWRDIMPNILSGMMLCSIGYVVTVGLLLVSLLLMPSYLFAIILFVVLTLVWAMVYVPVGQELMIGKCSFMDSLKSPFCKSADFTGTAAILLVSGLLMLVVMFVGLMPAISFIYVGGIADNAVQIGDTSDLPASFCMLRSIAFALSALIALIAWFFILVPLAFQWGSKNSMFATSNSLQGQMPK